MLKLLFLALDPVEHERAQTQIAHEHDESDEPSADHFIACRSDQIIAPETNAVCDLHNERRSGGDSGPVGYQDPAEGLRIENHADNNNYCYDDRVIRRRSLRR